MICPTCHADNPTGTKACICCGKALPSTGLYETDQYIETGNNSGSAEPWQVPRSVPGLTMAGFVPYGLYAFYNGMILWGVLGLLANIFFAPLYLVYTGYIVFYGRSEAWRHRRFRTMADYEGTMSAWNTAGIVCCLLLALMILVWSWAIMVLSSMGAALESSPANCGG